VDERQRRIGRNEALFREVNERIERVTQTLHATAETISILCECGNESCSEQLQISLVDYERIRSDATLFFVCSGHEIPDVEDIVEQQDAFDVVRKKEGSGAEIARELDPREN